MSAQGIGFGAGRASDGHKEIERLFSPEFRNRLDEIVRFDALPSEVMVRVVDKFIGEMREQLAEKKVTLVLEDDARTWLAEKGYDPTFGARPLARIIQTELKDRLTDQILFGPLAKGGRVRARLEDGKLEFSVDSDSAT